MKLLLHACCGPCSLEPVRLLLQEGHQLTIYYTNSNISPADEYAHRLNTLLTWAKEHDIPVIKGPYNPSDWEACAGRIGDAALEEDPLNPQRREARCRACYRLRFEEAAQFAQSNGFDALGTTLSVSPYQYTHIIKEELERAVLPFDIEAIFGDYRPYYDQATRRSRDEGMYRQNYCGCRISDQEAQEERALRKAQKAEAKKEAQLRQNAQRALDEEKRATKRQERQVYDTKQAQKRAILKAMREQNKSNSCE